MTRNEDREPDIRVARLQILERTGYKHLNLPFSPILSLSLARSFPFPLRRNKRVRFLWIIRCADRPFGWCSRKFTLRVKFSSLSDPLLSRVLHRRDMCRLLDYSDPVLTRNYSCFVQERWRATWRHYLFAPVGRRNFE